MINEKLTYKKFGYCSYELKPKSQRKIIAICDGCDKIRELRKWEYRPLCVSCSLKKYYKNNPDIRKGENHNMFGIHRFGKDAGNYIDGRTNKKYYCNCGNKISYRTYFYGKKRCRSCAQSGENNASYIDGRTPLAKLIHNLLEYKEWRTQIFRRDSYTCQECGDNKSGNLEAHHKKDFVIILQEFLQKYNQFSPIEDKETLVRLAITYEDFWDVDNGETLCIDCHKKQKRTLKRT